MSNQAPVSRLKTKNLVMFVGFLFLAFLFIVDTTVYIQPGYVGVFINKITGKIDEVPVHSGYKFKLPIFQQIVEYPFFMQTVVLTKDLNEGSPANEEINVNSIEGQPVSCDVSLSFTLQPEKIPFLYTSFRQTILNITHGFVKQSIRQSMQEIIGKMPIADFLGKSKAQSVIDIEEDLKGRLKQYGFEVRQFTINEVRAPQAVIDAISQKNIMEQDALRAQNELVKFQYEAQQKAERAKGKGKAILIEAESQAQANKILTASLSQTLVKYKAIEKWDGNLPSVSTTNGTNTLLNIKVPDAPDPEDSPDNSKTKKK